MPHCKTPDPISFGKQLRCSNVKILQHANGRETRPRRQKGRRPVDPKKFPAALPSPAVENSRSVRQRSDAGTYWPFNKKRQPCIERTVVSGMPDIDRISTSHVEKQNHTLRMHCRRLTRLTNAFSKKFENFEAAVALNFCYYNFVKTHGTIRMTPGASGWRRK
jgi:hypothetical protein